MKRSVSPLVLSLACAGACSLINSPEELAPVDAVAGTGATSSGGGGSGNAEGGGPDTPRAGAEAGPGGAGTMSGAGGCGDSCAPDTAGGAGGAGGEAPVGRDCSVSAKDCAGAAPICDAQAGTCRACQGNRECTDEVSKPFCLTAGTTAGRCVECKSNADCRGTSPVCGNLGACRACDANTDCDSGVCSSTGACADPSTAVYALAETGVGKPCGTLEAPCRNLADAASQLTQARSNLVLVRTTKKFIDSLTLPALKGLKVIGNAVAISPYDGKSPVTVPAGAAVVFENMVLSGGTADGQAGILCSKASIDVVASTLSDNAAGVLATDCDVSVTRSLIQNNAPTARAAGISATCTTASCTKLTSILRNRFIGNGVAVYVAGQANVEIQNNLFLRNGYDAYTRVIELRADKSHFAYNTLVENFNNGIYVGIVACNAGTCNNVGNISYNNFPGHPEYGDQVWYGGTLSYSLTEVTYPGTTNRTGDPKFVDAANGNFTPGPGSPALDKGNAADFPPLDIAGNKRPVGAGPDMGAVEAQ